MSVSVNATRNLIVAKYFVEVNASEMASVTEICGQGVRKEECVMDF